MLSWIFKALFGKSTPPANPPAAADQPATSSIEPPSIEPSQPATLPAKKILRTGSPVPVEGMSTERPPTPSHRLAKPPLAPAAIDLHLGLDIGTSCTKAVLGDSNSGQQTAIPLGGNGPGLSTFLRPTKVYLNGGSYSLASSKGATVCQNLKLQLIHGCSSGKIDRTCQEHLVAFTALMLQEIRKWHAASYATKHPGMVPCWWLNVGLPSKGGAQDVFADVYRVIIAAAVHLIDQEAAVDESSVRQALTQSGGESNWLPQARIAFYPEAAAQLSSLLLSPHCPDGCLVVVDVGAGTMDVSTLRVGRGNHEARCSFHFCEVAPLGVHFLHLARQGIGRLSNLSDADLKKALDTLPEDNGLLPFAAPTATNGTDQTLGFRARCKEVVLANIVKFRRSLKRSHVSPNYDPFPHVLPYILSGGGHRDSFYQILLDQELEEWLLPCTDWQLNRSDRANWGQGMKRLDFPFPHQFSPRSLKSDFDRFSVAHGLSLGADNLMKIR